MMTLAEIEELPEAKLKKLASNVALVQQRRLEAYQRKIERDTQRERRQAIKTGEICKTCQSKDRKPTDGSGYCYFCKRYAVARKEVKRHAKMTHPQIRFADVTALHMHQAVKAAMLDPRDLGPLVADLDYALPKSAEATIESGDWVWLTSSRNAKFALAKLVSYAPASENCYAQVVLEPVHLVSLRGA